MDVVKVEGGDEGGVGRITLNRPGRGNALDDSMFLQLPAAFRAMESDPTVRVVLLCGAGAHFCTGIDLSTLAAQSAGGGGGDDDGSRARAALRRRILDMQAAISAPEWCCSKPVVAVIQGACIGAGLDLAAACDLRYCAADARLSVREVAVGITADLGSLQRLPSIVGHARAMELALTARTLDGGQAQAVGLVHAAFGSREELERGALEIARHIASSSPLAVAGTKAVLLRSRDLSVAQGLDYVATWNAAMLSVGDIAEASASIKEKNKLKAAARL